MRPIVCTALAALLAAFPSQAAQAPAEKPAEPAEKAAESVEVDFSPVPEHGKDQPRFYTIRIEVVNADGAKHSEKWTVRTPMGHKLLCFQIQKHFDRNDGLVTMPKDDRLVFHAFKNAAIKKVNIETTGLEEKEKPTQKKVKP